MENTTRPSQPTLVEPFPEPFEMLPRDLEFEARQKRRMQNRIAQRNSRNRRRSKQKNQQHQQLNKTTLATRDSTPVTLLEQSSHQERATPPYSSSPSSCWSAQNSTATSPTSGNLIPQCEITVNQVGGAALDSEFPSVEMAQQSSQRTVNSVGSQVYHPSKGGIAQPVHWDDAPESAFVGSPPLHIPNALQFDNNQTATLDLAYANQHMSLGAAHQNNTIALQAHSIPWSIRQLAESSTRNVPAIATHEHLTNQVSMLHMSIPSSTTANRARNIPNRGNFIEPHLQGTTPLHVAAKSGNDSMVHLLLQSGADVNARDISGLTPLHLAVESGHVQTACSLLQAGADTSCVDRP